MTITLKGFMIIIKNYKPPIYIIVLAILCTLFQTALSLIIPLQAMELINILVEKRFSYTILGFLILLFILQIIFSSLSIYMMVYVGEKIIYNLRKDLWSKVINFPVKFYDENNSNEVMSRITNDTNIMKNFFVDHLIPSITGFITIIGSLIILFILNWKLSLIFLIVFPLAFLIITPLGKKIYIISKNTQHETALFQGDLGRVLSNIRLVKMSVAEPNETKKGNKRIHELYNYGLDTGKVMAFVSPIMNTTILMVLVLILGFGIYQVTTNELTAGELIAVIFYIFQIMSPLTLMAQLFTQYQKAMGSSERVLTLLSEPTEEHFNNKINTNTESNLIRAEKALEVENLHFSYNKDNKILKGISFKAMEGKKTAIIGGSGGGKTTIFSIIERFYLIDHGDIKFNGKSIYEYSLSEWRSIISYVSQDTPIMEGTLYDNLVYGIENIVSEEAIYQALDTANLTNYVESLPKRLETEVGEKGVRLSGGQKQRLSIARAIIKNSTILLLDESTSHLDSESELLVQKALDNILAGKITIIIAHRLSTIIDSDNIMVVQSGKIVEQGTHQKLYNSSNLYNKLLNQQNIK